MRTYRIPRTDLIVSRLGYGIGMLDVDWRRSDLIASSVKAIRTAHDSGVTFFDTADIYAEGQSEAAMGEVLRDSPGLRNELVIQSKCGFLIRDRWQPGQPMAANSLGVDLSYGHIVSAVEASLQRLGTDRLDILLLHVPSALMIPEEIAQAFDELHRAGKVLYFGVSDHNVVQVELLRKHVRQPLVANQIWLSLVHHAPIQEKSGFGALVDWCRLNDIQVQAFSPLKGGSIFAKPLLLNSPPDANPQVRQLAQALADTARRHSATPAAVMLAWLLRHPVGIVPIIGSTSPAHIAENCVADRVKLTREEWETLLACAEPLQLM